ncbi:MAG: hypothetical protein JST75_09840 [Bacteroidetes bacterium]|nr:hypothetical protein [Bacteroidota bacterium]
MKRIFRNLYFLTFLNGFLLATLFYFKMEGNYERELFAAIQSNIDSKINLKDNDDSVVVNVMHACNELLTSRSAIFTNQTLDGFKVDLLQPTSIDLMTAKGACGSYSLVLARTLENYKFPVRIAQMKVNGVFAAHNIVEVKTNSGWAVLDPLFNVYFIRPDKTLASFQDVKNNWNYYKDQLPPNYNMNYKYEDVRYSNWGKIPFVLPAIKKILDLVLGKERADTISMRIYFLRMYDLYFYILLGLYLPVAIFIVRKLIKTKVFPQPNIPITPSNIIKYARARIANKTIPNTIGRPGSGSLS